MLMELAGRAPLTQDMLDQQDSYILDHGGNKIFVWHGKLSTRDERKSSMIYASVSAAGITSSRPQPGPGIVPFRKI